MTFLFASATQIGTISILMGATSYMAGFSDMNTMINIAVGVGFLFVYGLVFQGLSLYHLMHSVYVMCQCRVSGSGVVFCDGG